jgi:hypothetical protein
LCCFVISLAVGCWLLALLAVGCYLLAGGWAVVASVASIVLIVGCYFVGSCCIC